MIEIPNSFDLMTNMHHTNPQLVEINQLTQRNAELRGSNKLMKFAFVGLLVIAVVIIYKSKRNKTSDSN